MREINTERAEELLLHLNAVKADLITTRLSSIHARKKCEEGSKEEARLENIQGGLYEIMQDLRTLRKMMQEHLELCEEEELINAITQGR